MSAPTLFEFRLRAVQADRTGYYMTRWDRAQSVTVRAETKQEAINKAAAMLGDAQCGWYWTFALDGANEVTP